ncbi:MAG: SGNH/GDSL hydrolase family protein [Tenuifilaceae bacterium]|nr:SGNH/GDSL hydrolase family protein [Tenuifilaceae bacterium]
MKLLSITLTLLTSIIMCSCNQVNTENTQAKKITYLALGDSYTIGEGVADSLRYPNQLKERLAQSGINIENLKIIARTGWTTDELQAWIERDSITPPYNLVTLLIGVNNQYRGRDAENYREEFKILLNKAIEFAGGKSKSVIVISIPDWGVTPFAKERDGKKIAAEIDKFNSINLEETQKSGAFYVNVTSISRLATNEPNLLATDGLHPSGKMYKLWVNEIYPVANNILK